MIDLNRPSIKNPASGGVNELVIGFVVLTGRHFKNPSCLEPVKSSIFLRMRFCPVVIGRQVVYRTKQPLVVSFKHSFTHQLLLVVEQAIREFSRVGALPVQDKPRPDHGKGFSGDTATGQPGFLAKSGQYGLAELAFVGLVFSHICISI